MPSPLRAVFFDAGGTLLHVRGSVGEIYARTAARLGYPVDAGSVQRSFQGAWKRSLERRREIGYFASDEIIREEWRKIVTESFDGLLPVEAAGKAFLELYEHFSGPEPWDVAPGADETLAALRGEGLALGILSNWDSRLPGCLKKLGILQFFDHLVISYDVGLEKPHPQIFEEAARRVEAPPESLTMVGDSLEQDITPAFKLGWNVFWLSCREEPNANFAEPSVEKVKNFAEVLMGIKKRLERDRSEGK